MSMRVLICEPDWRFAHRAASYLESHAHHVALSASAFETEARARRWHPDLVILAAESATPDLLNTLHSIPEGPAVLLTGWLDRYDIAWRAWQMGGHELLLKPIFRDQELQDSILTAMENAVAGVRQSQATSVSA